MEDERGWEDATREEVIQDVVDVVHAAVRQAGVRGTGASSPPGVPTVVVVRGGNRQAMSPEDLTVLEVPLSLSKCALCAVSLECPGCSDWRHESILDVMRRFGVEVTSPRHDL